MRKLRQNNSLQQSYAPPTARPAFSLAELVISVGILVLLMSLAGQIFSFTVESTGQATALTKINQTIRMMERTIREDLAQVQAGRAIMIIQGNPVNAYWTADGKEADNDGEPSNGYDIPVDPDREYLDSNGDTIPLSPRADVLMFVTARKGQSFVNPNMNTATGSQPLTSQLQLVTYGMAELGDYTYDAATSTPTAPAYDFTYPYGTNATGAPNSPVVPTAPGTPPYPSTTNVSPFPASQWHLSRRAVLLLSTPYKTLSDALASDPSAKKNLMPSTLDAENFQKLIESSSDFMAGVSLEEDILRPDVLPYLAADISNKWPWYLPSFLTNNTDAFNGLMLTSPSMVDTEPPPLLAKRMGHYFLPNCASFKVEWALDPQSEFVNGRLDGINDTLWFDPGDNGDPLLPASTGPDPLRSAALMLQKLGAQIGNLAANKGKQEYLLERQKNLTSLIQDPWVDGSMTNYCDEQTGYSLQDRFRGPSQSHTDPAAAPTCGWPHPFNTGIQRPNMHVFTATRPKLQEDSPGSFQYEWNGEDLAPDPMFPGSLRITIDMYDKEGRLERPIRHVMIIPLGG